MAWFKYLKSNEIIDSATPNYNYSYPYCKRFIQRFTPRDTLEANTWIFASISDVNINTYKNTSLEDIIDNTSYLVTYEKAESIYPVATIIQGNYIYFKTYEKHTAAEEIAGQYAIYYNTPNLRKINLIDNGGIDDYQINLAPVWQDIELEPFIYGDPYSDGPSAVGTIYTISSGALPTGLSINSSTGQITGTVGSSGSYSFTVRATTDDGKYYNEATFAGTIYEYVEWVDSSLSNIDYNTPYSNSVWADGYPTPTYSISAGELPSYITLNSSTGLVSGTTLDSGPYAFTIKAENAIGSVTQSFTGTVQAPPSWSDQTLGPITQSVSYSDSVSATGTATITYSVYSGSLPTGLSLNSSTGAITGTTNSTGSYNFTIRATNSWGHASKTFTGTIYTAPSWTDTSISLFVENEVYSDSIVASSYPAPTYSVWSGTLPSGISLNSSTGAITGTPTAYQFYDFTIKAENVVGSITYSFTGEVQSIPYWSDETIGIIYKTVNYSDAVLAIGSSPITYSISSGSLPTGIILDSSSGVFTGGTSASGAYTFTVRATNSIGYVEKSFSGTIYESPSWTDSTIANIIYGQAYSDSVTASGYPSVTYSLRNGSGPLPSGITLDSSTGAIVGTSTEAGSYAFTIKAENILGSVEQLFTDSLFVSPSWTDNELSTFSYENSYADSVTATGTPTYTISSGTLPTGLSLNSSTGEITGYITYYGAYSFVVQAANETGSVTQSFSGGINKVPTWTDAALADAEYNTAYSDSVSVAAYPTATFSVTSGSLPAGLTLSSSGTLSGTPTANGNYSFTITATNTVGSISSSFNLNVGQSPQWSDVNLNNTYYGNIYVDSVYATGYPAPTYSITSGSLPNGLSLNSSTGEVSGVTSSSGQFNFQITATNSGGTASLDTGMFVFRVPVWTDQTLATPTYNTPYSDGVTATGYDGTSQVYYQISSGSLPSGFSIDIGTGAITGTYTSPVNGSSFTYNFTVRAFNSVGEVTKSFTWTITIPFTTSGGTSWTNPGAGYTGVYFTSSGTFTVNTGNKSLEVLVVGGGGGGGGGAYSGGNYYVYPPGYWVFREAAGGGAGGGAGGTTTGTPYITTGNYSISVGAAGAGGSSYNAGAGTGYGYQGSSGVSSVASLGGTNIGVGGGSGGYGGYADSYNSYAVGQAGGYSGDSRAGGSGSGSGNNGAGGGGGGYTTNGGNASGSTPGTGGDSRTWNGVTVGGGGSGASFGSDGTTSSNRGGGGGGGRGAIANGLTATGGVVYIRWLT